MLRRAASATALALATALAPWSFGAPADTRQAYDEIRKSTGRDADAQVKLALWCEAHGLEAERVRHLALAVLRDPTHATARGLMGLVEYRGHWSRPEAVAAEVRSDQSAAESLGQYNARRDKLKNTAEGHYALALWCEEVGLKAEATAHFTFAARLDPSKDLAWKHLGYKKVDGVWASEEQHLARKMEIEAQSKADKLWRPRFEQWRTWLGDKGHRASAEAKLAEVTDPRAVPALMATFKAAPGAAQGVAVRTLGQVDGVAASLALASFALRADSAETRRVAVEILRRRDPREFVDAIIAELHKPLPYEVRQVEGPGSPGVLFVEGEKYNVRRVYNPAPQLTRVPPRSPLAEQVFGPATPLDPASTRAFLDGAGYDLRDRSLNGQTYREILEREVLVRQALAFNARVVALDTQNAAQRLASDIREVEATNAAILAVDERAKSVLQASTGKDLGDDPAAWQAWWTDQKGYAYVSPSTEAPKPTYSQLVELESVSIPPHNACFGAGTPVRTLDGMRPIESIRVGDRVVVQNTRTGVIQYRPVVAIFHNKPASTLKIRFPNETIVATGIHRFWKAGKGWTMARDLVAGDPIRTLDGVARVESIEPERVQPVFNLEVSEGRDYFVGTTGFLVHDNSLVESTPEPFDAPGPALASADSSSR